MPIGILVNVSTVFLGGLVGTVLGPRLTLSFREKINTVFSACTLAMGINSIIALKNLPAVVLAVILGTILGILIRLGDRIEQGGLFMQRAISRITGHQDAQDEAFQSTLVTALVLFCASGTGLYGSLISGMTGDHSILLTKSFLSFFSAMIFSCTLGAVTSLIAIPQLAVFLSLFFLAKGIYPFCSPAMIGDFKACGGILLLATGFRMMKVKEFPVADMIPAMLLVMPLSALWTRFVG